MKFSFFISLTLCVLFSHAQEKRQNISTIGYIEVMFKDSSEVWAMMWDDFTFEYDENHSEIILVEGGSNKKIKYKAKHIDYIKFKNDGEDIYLKRYKSPRGRDHILLNEIHQNGQYQLLESPNFVFPIFKYIAFKGEVFSILPEKNHDFLQFFNCDKLYDKYGKEDNHELSIEEMINRLDLYLANCLTPVEKVKKEEDAN